MEKKFNDLLIRTIRNRIPESEQMAPYLGKLLFLGKEAIYRRIRGDVDFTFEELATLSTKLGFSIDSLVGLNGADQMFFDTNLHHSLAPEDAYYNILFDYVDGFLTLNSSKSVVGYFVNNHLPYVFSLYLETVSKFRYYRWMHQANGIDPRCPMSQIVVPPRIEEIEKSWMDQTSNKQVESTYMFDHNLFATMCRDIAYFYKNQLLTDQELQSMQGELLALVDFLEEVARTGVSPSGAPMLLYITPFDLITNYMYFEFDNNVCAQVHLNNINHLLSFDPQVCVLHKQWINQLKRYAVLITQSGEMQRLAYFKKQREFITQIHATP